MTHAICSGYFGATAGRIGVLSTESGASFAVTATCKLGGVDKGSIVITQPVGYGDDNPLQVGVFAGFAGYLDITGLEINQQYDYTVTQDGVTLTGQFRTEPNVKHQILGGTCEFHQRGLLEDPFSLMRRYAEEDSIPVAAYAHIDDILYLDTTRVNNGDGIYISTDRPFISELMWDYVLGWMAYYGLRQTTNSNGGELFNIALRTDRTWVLANVNQWRQGGDHEFSPDFGTSIQDPSTSSSGRPTALLAIATNALQAFCLDFCSPPPLDEGNGMHWAMDFGGVHHSSPDRNTFSQPYDAMDFGDTHDAGRINTDSFVEAPVGGHLASTNPSRTQALPTAWNSLSDYGTGLAYCVRFSGTDYISLRKSGNLNEQPDTSTTYWEETTWQGPLSDQFPGMGLPIQYRGDSQNKDLLDSMVASPAHFHIQWTPNGLSKRNEPFADRWPLEFNEYINGTVDGTDGIFKQPRLNGSSGKIVLMKGDSHGRERTRYSGISDANVLGGAGGYTIEEWNCGTINGSNNAGSLGDMGIDYQNGDRIYRFDSFTQGQEGTGSTLFGSFTRTIIDTQAADPTLEVQIIDSSDGEILQSGIQFKSVTGNNFLEEKPVAQFFGDSYDTIDPADNAAIALDRSVCFDTDLVTSPNAVLLAPSAGLTNFVAHASLKYSNSGTAVFEARLYNTLFVSGGAGAYRPTGAPLAISTANASIENADGWVRAEIPIDYTTTGTEDGLIVAIRMVSGVNQALFGAITDPVANADSYFVVDEAAADNWVLSTKTAKQPAFQVFYDVPAGSPTLTTPYTQVNIVRGASGSFELSSNWTGASTFDISQLPNWCVQSGTTGTINYTNACWGTEQSDVCIGDGLWQIQIQAVDSTGLFKSTAGVSLRVSFT